MKRILIFSLFVLVGLSCKKTFLDETPRDVLAPDDLYINKAGFEQGLYGLYNQIRQERGGYYQDSKPSNPGYTDPTNDISNGIMMVGVDNAYCNYPGSSNEKYYNQFSTGGPITLVSDDYNITIFGWFYKVILGANMIIHRADDPGINWTAAEKGQIVGEAKTIRYWAYRHLTFLWGAVPLVLEESSGLNVKTDYTRTPVAQIRAQMEQDLKYADSTMADNAVVEGRFSKAVADHYLTELYLTEGRYQEAENMANKIINNPMYKLVGKSTYGSKTTGNPFADMFIDGNSNRTQGNTEAIYVIQNAYNSPTAGDFNIMRRMWVNRYDQIKIGSGYPIAVSIANGGRGIGRYAATHYVFQCFSPSVDGRTGSSSQDQRGGATGGILSWRYSWSYPGSKLNLSYNTDETINNSLWPCPRKWDWAPPANFPNDVANSSGYNCQIYIRLAEEYLFLAEAQYYLGDLAGAAQSINLLRARANAPLISAADISIDFILDERTRELFTEEHRRYTLLRIRDPQNPSVPIWIRRTNQYNKIIANNVPVIANDTLLPIPQAVINANIGHTDLMPQNPGY